MISRRSSGGPSLQSGAVAPWSFDTVRSSVIYELSVERDRRDGIIAEVELFARIWPDEWSLLKGVLSMLESIGHVELNAGQIRFAEPPIDLSDGGVEAPRESPSEQGKAADLNEAANDD